MTLYLRRKADLDPNDPRRWVRPKDSYRDHPWDLGFVSVMPHECLEAMDEKRKEERRKLGEAYIASLEQQKRTGWLHLNELRPVRGKAPRLGYHPSCTVGVDTNDCDARSDISCCNGEASMASSEQQKRSGWLQLNKLRPFMGKAYHPSRTMGVDTSDCDAHSDISYCNGCGITHWRRHCPLNRDQGASETAPN